LLPTGSPRPMLPGMASTRPNDGFLHRGQIIYALQYHTGDGSILIVWLDRAGNDVNGRTRHLDKSRAT